MPWLPESIIDCHVHVGKEEFSGPVSDERRRQSWAFEVGPYQSWEELRRTCSALFPGLEVGVLAFGNVHREVDLAAGSEYVLAGLSDHRNKAYGLLVTAPGWDPAAIEAGMSQGFAGIKPYPDLAPGGGSEVSIYDFLPESHLAAVDRLGGIVMLHLPRSGRIADPDNVREVLEIADRYTSITLIVAHIGRAYCLPTAKRGLPRLVGRENIYFDTACNLNPDVLQYALELVGSGRILFGSDLPVTLMRGVRDHIGEDYINYTDGPYSWNTNRKTPEQESRYTNYLYEELLALITAVRRAGLGLGDMHRIMYHNSARMLPSRLSRSPVAVQSA